MLRRLGLIFATLALFAIAGGHWAVLQSVAWAGMLHDYTGRTGSFVVAVEQTFDGAHRCALCRQIQAGKVTEHKGDATMPTASAITKAKALPAETLPRIGRPAGRKIFNLGSEPLPGPDRSERPPTPPPRSILAA